MAVLTQSDVLLNKLVVANAITEKQHLLLVGPDVITRRSANSALTASLSLGSYTGSQISAAWPLLGAGEVVDTSTTKITVKDGARQYYTETTRPVADSGSIMANRTNYLRFNDRVLKTANGSNRDAALPVDVSVGDWFSFTNALAKTVTGRVTALIADVVAATVGAPAAVAGNVGTPTVAAGGTFTGPSALTYTIRVTTGGSTNGSTAKVSVTSSTGVDQSGPHFVMTGVAISIGSYGTTFTLTGATLTANDAWTIAVTPATGGTSEVGGAIRTVVLDTPLEALAATVASNWIGVNITAKFGFYGDFEVSRGKIGNAPAVNWTAAASTITLSASMVVRDSSTGTTDLLVTKGTAYVDYGAIRTVRAGTIYPISKPADLTALGMDYSDVDNLLAYTANLCVDDSGVNTVYILPVASNDVTGYGNVRSAYLERPDWTCIAPLTTDTAVINTIIADINTRSTSSYRMWSDVMVHQPYSLTSNVVKLRADGSISSATVLDDPGTAGTQYTLVTDSLGQFVTKGVLAGDSIRLSYASDGFGTETYVSVTISSVLSEQTLLISTALSSSVPVASRYEIWRTLTPAAALAAAGAAAAAYNNSHVIPVFGDAVVGSSTIKGFQLAALVGAERTYAAPHQGLAGLQLTQVTSVPSSSVFTGLYTQARNYGMYVVRQLYTGECIIDSAATSAITDSDLKFDSVRRTLDSVLRYLGSVFEAYRGRTNNTDGTLTRLNNDFKNALNFLSSGTTVKDLGNMLTSGQLTSLTKSNAAPDGVEASFTLVIPGPLNNIEFIVDLSVG